MNVVLCFSGGLDSTVLLYQQLAAGNEVLCLGVDYGQKHIREIEDARALSNEVNTPYEVVKIGGTPFGATALTGHGTGVVVPNRNAVLLSIATSVALRDNFDAVAIGCHSGDHAVWPDCRPAFLDAMQQVMFTCDNRKIQLLRPFIRQDKLDIVRAGIELDVPFERTWSCYNGGATPCGTCPACIGRREALFLAGVLPCS